MIKKLIFSFVTIFLFAISAIQAQENKPLVLKGATIYDGTGNSLTNGIIVIKDGRIQKIGDEDLSIPEKAEIINVSGKYIMPGMVDAHIHFFQTAFFDSRPDAADLRDSIPFQEVYDYQKENPERYYPSYLGSGVTAVYDVGDYLWTLDLQENNDSKMNAPHVAAAGPLITPVPQQAIAPFEVEGDSTFIPLISEEIGRKAVQQNSSLGSTGIKIWLFRPDDPQFIRNIEAVSDEIEKQENKMIAHATSLKEAKLALELDAKLLVHSVTDTIVDQEFLDLLLEKDALYNPTLVVGRGYYNTYKAVLGEEFEINDPHGIVDYKTRELLQNAEDFKKFLNDSQAENLQKALPGMNERLEKEMKIMMTNLKKVYDAGGKIVVGTDAGNPGTLHGVSFIKEIEAMQAAGIPAKELIVMATRNGAMAMERLEDFGTLEEGKIADLIILEKDPGEDIGNLRSLSRVMRLGNFYEQN